MAITTSNGGTISVPISSILDALGSELNEAERTALFQKLIGFRVNEVQPGDLIRAALFNQMLGDINDLAIRVAKLEAGADTRPRPPVITRIEPQVVRTGEEFTVIGENLDPERLTRIDINQTTIPLSRIKKPGSGPTQLVLDAPAVMGLPPGGATVIIAVWNAAGSAQRGYVQLPGETANLQANVTFAPKPVKPGGDILAGMSYEYPFELDIHSSHKEQFVLVPQISGTGWSAVVKDSDRIDVTSASAVDGHKETKVITVTAGASGSATLVLNLRGTNFPTFNASSQPTTITIGATQPIPTGQILFSTATLFGGAADRKFENNTLWVKRQPGGGTNGFKLTVPTQLKVGGTFAISSPTATPAADWQVSRETADSINFTDPNGGTTGIAIKVTPKSSGGQFTAADGVLTFTVGNAQLQSTYTAQLRVVDTLP